MRGYKKSFSKTAKREFYNEMQEINEFCSENGIVSSLSNDSYYFQVDGQKYRVSNHTIESSNKGAYHDVYGQIRPLYHDNREDEVIYIHTSKTRIREIYSNLKLGYKLNGKGYRVYEN